MAIFETGIIVDNRTLLEKKYYDEHNPLDKNLRMGLLQAITSFAQDAFNTEINSFSLEDYTIVIELRMINEPDTEGSDENNFPKHKLILYAIIEKETNLETLMECMKEIVEQFLNRYSINDILYKDSHHFRKFLSRFDKIYKDLILKPEDRFGSLFDL